MGAPTFWEVHEYHNGSPVLAFTAGAGGHAAADAHGTSWYVESESGWRDGAAMRDTSAARLAADGAWTGPQYKEPFLVHLSGFYVGASQEATRRSIRDARNTLGRQWRSGRLLADEEGHRLFADVMRGGQVIVTPSSPIVGTWSMAFRVDDPVYASELVAVSTVRPANAARVGRGYTDAYASAYQTGITGANDGALVNGGDAPGHFTARITGPASGFSLMDSATGRTLVCGTSVPAGTEGVLDTRSRTFLLNGVNARWAISGQWFMVSPGESRFTFTPTGGNNATKAEIHYHAETWEG